MIDENDADDCREVVEQNENVDEHVDGFENVDGDRCINDEFGDGDGNDDDIADVDLVHKQ